MGAKAKHKREYKQINYKRYWRVLIPLTIVLFLGLWFPIRILLIWELNFLLYGGIAMLCGYWLLKLWQFRKTTRLLKGVIFLCGLLATVQLTDCVIRPPHLYPPNSSTICRNAGDIIWNEPWDSGLACHFYVERGCFIDIERYLGTHLLAVGTNEHYRRLICE